MAVSRRRLTIVIMLALLVASSRTHAQARAVTKVTVSPTAPADAPTPAMINGHALSLSVHSGATCVDRELLIDELEAQLDDTPVPAAVIVEVVGSDDDPRTVTTRVRSVDGSVAERTFSPTPNFCPYLHQVLALTLGLALKATLASPEDDSMVPLAPAAEVPSVSLPASAIATPPGPVFSAAIGPLFTVGALGQTVFGALAELASRFRFGSVRADFQWMRAPKASLVGGAGEYQLSMFAGRVTGCGRLPLRSGARALEACLGGAVGRAGVAQHGGRGHDHTARTLWIFSPTLAFEQDVGAHVSVRMAASLLTLYRPLRIAARDESGNVVATDDIGRLGGLFSVTLGYHGIIRLLQR